MASTGQADRKAARSHRGADPGIVLPEASGSPVVLGARLASEANISDSPANKTRVMFQVGESDADLKLNIADLVKQLNAEWSKVSDRLASLEKFETDFVSNTLPVIQDNVKSIGIIGAKVENVPDNLMKALEERLASMQLTKNNVDEAFASAVKIRDELKADDMVEGIKKNLNDMNVFTTKYVDFETTKGEVDNLKAKCMEFEAQHDKAIASLKSFGEDYAKYSEKTDAHIAKVTKGKFTEHQNKFDAMEAIITQ